jgi:hypothetical protein
MPAEVKDRTVRHQGLVSHKVGSSYTVIVIVQKTRMKCCQSKEAAVVMISDTLVLRHQATTSKRNADNCRLALA